MNKKQRFKLILCCVGLLLLEAPASAELRIPPTPAQDGHGDFVQDYAGIINDGSDIDRIGEAQRVAFEEHDTPIIVVVVTRMASYGHHQPHIEPFATQWFNQWEVGTENTNGKNQGVLLLISVGDRKGRIELGADWGRNFDDHCQVIMNEIMIPYFKAGDYSLGITEGVESLLKMAKEGIKGNAQNIAGSKPKSYSFKNMSRSSKNILFAGLPFRIFAIVLGIIGVVLAGRKLESGSLRTTAFWCGGVLIILGVFPPLLFLAMIVVMFVLIGRSGGGGGRSSYSGGSWGGGGGFSGGGFSGGSSGGGGASGSW